MKVFISWSGDRSHALAEVLHDWIPNVLQAVEPWLSSEDIQKGSRWPLEIGAQLATADFGIFCVTPDNLQAPWLNFEAGAVSKAIAQASVATVLLGLTAADVAGPLAQFQHTQIHEQDMLKLVRSLNSRLQQPLADAKLQSAFSRWWPELVTQLDLSSTRQVDRPTPRDERDMLEEVLALLRDRDRAPFDPSAAGVQKIVANFHTIEWEQYFRGASRVDLLFAYAESWRMTHADDLQTVLQRPGARVRVILPDATDAATTAELGRRFGIPAEAVKSKIEDAVSDFRHISETMSGSATLKLYTMDRAPVYSYYRIEETVVVTPYQHSVERRPVPSLILDRYGILGRFFDSDFDEVIANHAKLHGF